jgi:hypothetical protein
MGSKLVVNDAAMGPSLEFGDNHQVRFDQTQLTGDLLDDTLGGIAGLSGPVTVVEFAEEVGPSGTKVQKCHGSLRSFRDQLGQWMSWKSLPGTPSRILPQKIFCNILLLIELLAETEHFIRWKDDESLQNLIY